MLVKLLVNNIAIDLSYNLNKYTRYKHVWKRFQEGRLHQHSVIALYYLDKKSWWKFLRILVIIVHFTDRNWIFKTVYSSWWIKFFVISSRW